MGMWAIESKEVEERGGLDHGVILWRWEELSVWGVAVLGASCEQYSHGAGIGLEMRRRHYPNARQ